MLIAKTNNLKSIYPISVFMPINHSTCTIRKLSPVPRYGNKIISLLTSVQIANILITGAQKIQSTSTVLEIALMHPSYCD